MGLLLELNLLYEVFIYVIGLQSVIVKVNYYVLVQFVNFLILYNYMYVGQRLNLDQLIISLVCKLLGYGI